MSKKNQRMRKYGMLVLMLGSVIGAASGQDASTPPAAGEPSPSTSPSASQSAPQEPVPAYGQENAPPLITDNPPLTGLDVPTLEPHAAPLSYLQPGATFSESADSNIGNLFGSGSIRSVSRAVGSITLQRLWSHYDLALDYVGGVAYYNLKGLGFKTLQQMDIDQKISWKRGQLSLRDSFSYLPEGNFGGAYGSLGSQGIASLGSSAFGSFWGGSSFSGIGEVPRLSNVSLADVSENLNSKSAVTAAAGYAVTHFYGDNPLTQASYLNSSQVSAQVGYNRSLTAQTQVAMVYGYQGFDFSTFGNAFHSNIIQVMYGHRVSGRMDFVIGAGPQFTHIDTLTIFGTSSEQRLGVSGRARLRYKFPKTSVDLVYERYLSSGSGLFAGAQTDLARLNADRPINRVWSAFADLGYSRNSRLQPLSAQELTTCDLGGSNPNLPPCPGVEANTYRTGFAGFGLHRAFGRNYHGFLSYQFNEAAFDHSFCPTDAACSRISNRHVITIGLDWTPRPIRID